MAAAVAAAALVAACAPKDAPVCQPVFSLATPAYGCPGGAPDVPLVQDTPPPPPVDEPLAPVEAATPQLAAIGDTKINLAEKLQFETGKAVLLPASEPILDQVAEILYDHPEILQIRIEGHTDSQGAAGANLRLSQQRAEAVRTYLEHHGIAATRMIAKGFGETRPIADNKLPEGRETNRRVELVITKRK
ncbi:MAG TPA: OmpA family protein [Kofleriaceae bacterium]|nr:OmpA family protein [Kofleriaceae bacterium]